jgi:cobyrinic acid a,c-diamide synthase
MKAIMITAPSSGSGKTTITMGLIRALKKKGLRVSAFKTGPDYIDKAFLETASGNFAGNLDMHLQGEEGMKNSLALADGDCCVIEGAMGYFDGIYNTWTNSSYHISSSLGVNAVMVYTPKGEMFSAIPKIKGMVEFEDSRIRAVILNKVNKHYYTLLKEQIEKYTGLKVLGFIPDMEDVELKSRHLGLVQSSEINDIESKLDKLSEVILNSIDMDMLISIMNDMDKAVTINTEKRNIKVAVAMDKAFSFYYRENLDMLEKSCEVVYFSPMNDSILPYCDFLYLGGGYPEIFREELSENASMLESIREFSETGGCIYAECGGFMYLTENIEGSEMVGVFKGKSEMTSKLQRFGYINLDIKKDCILGKVGDTLTAHEFHRSVSTVEGEEIYKIRKTMGEKAWECGYSYKNTLGGYPHISFLGNKKAFSSMLDYIENNKKFEGS